MKLKDVDMLIVVGDPRSNNSNQLKNIGLTAGIPDCILIESAQNLQESDIKGKKRIAVTSGSSTPNELTSQEYAETGIWKPAAPIEASLL